MATISTLRRSRVWLSPREWRDIRPGLSRPPDAHKPAANAKLFKLPPVHLSRGLRGLDWRAWFTFSPSGRYLLAATMGTAAIWLIALAVVMYWPRSFTVDTSLILPNSEPDARVDLKGVGEAYSTSRNNYDSKSLDPRVNYKEIILSPTVLEAAAKISGLDRRDFDGPRVKLIDQSSVIELRVIGKSAEQAFDKAKALTAAFNARVQALRVDEMAQRESAIEHAIKNSRSKLTAAQRDLVNFKIGSQIVSEKQLEDIAMQSTTLQRRYTELTQKLANYKAIVLSLCEQLGLPRRIAGMTLTLQGDSVFLEHFKQFATASALVSDAEHKWEINHPKVREATALRDGAMASMTARARSVLTERVADNDLRRMAMVMQDRSRDILLRELVSAQANAEAAQAELDTIRLQTKEMAAQLPKLAGESAQLDDLRRQVNFTEAVFTSALGKTDVGSANVFSSYPMVQVLVAPAMPLKPSSPQTLFVAAGAALATLLWMVGLTLAWLRRP
jgi:uncharacterized protein involved in exopolysaccharide biosynthesis